jgi:hypothetical protein
MDVAPHHLLLWDLPCMPDSHPVPLLQHPMTATVMNNLGEALARQKRFEAAEPLVRSALEVSACLSGRTVPDSKF